MGGALVDATINVIDSDRAAYFAVAEAQAADIDRAVSAAREAFDNGPWPWLTHAERADYLRAIGELLATVRGHRRDLAARGGRAARLRERRAFGAQRTFD